MSDQETLTFKEKYILTDTWQEKAVLISLYHTAMCLKFDGKFGKYKWTLSDTAEHFSVSLGLVSENIRLAHEIDNGNQKIIKSKTREEGLKLIDKRRYLRIRD